MEKRQLGHSDISVSIICLGTMTWGEQNSEKEAHDQLDLAWERGVNFIDTAELYPVPPKRETYSLTESYIGNWAKLKSIRSDIHIATKIVGPGDLSSHIRGEHKVFSKEDITTALEGSLKRLQTDYVDLYQLHWPARHANSFGRRGFQKLEDQYTEANMLETLHCLNELKAQGKIKEFGLSNETPWGALKFKHLAEQNNLTKPVSVQNPYSLLNRLYEVGLAEVSLRENISLLPYSPLGFGVLTGKYLGGQKPEGARLSRWSRFGRYTNENGIKATEAYVKLAKDLELTPTSLALAFVNNREFVTSNIIGATNLKQLEENIASANVKLTEEALDAIEAIHESIPNPCP